MSVGQSVIVGGVVLAVAVVLGTIVARLVPAGSWRRNAEDLGIILGCASAPLALLARFTHHRSWPYAAVIAIAYGGFYLIRMRQLRNANRDGVRRLLGLHRDASYGEVLQQVERIEPRPVTALGVIIDQFTAALAGVALGVAEGTVRAAYRRSLTAKVRRIGK